MESDKPEDAADRYVKEQTRELMFNMK
jgi:hypothetical protein